MVQQLSGDNLETLKQFFPVSRETGEKLTIYADLLKKWQKSQNLVSLSTLDAIWMRHFADSLQLLDFGRNDGPWVDLGSGAGFPGLVIAIAGQERKNHQVHLIESNQGKCAFLQEVIRQTDASAIVHSIRVEDIGDKLPKGAKTLTARALAPLDRLCSYVAPLLGSGSIALFPKGRDFADELSEAKKTWQIEYEVIPSKTDAQAAIIRIASLNKHRKIECQ